MVADTSRGRIEERRGRWPQTGDGRVGAMSFFVFVVFRRVCGGVPTCPKRGRGLAELYSHWDRFSWRPLSFRPNPKPARRACVALWEPKSHRQCGRPPCPLGLLRWLRGSHRRKARDQGVALLNSPFARDLAWSSLTPLVGLVGGSCRSC